MFAGHRVPTEHSIATAPPSVTQLESAPACCIMSIYVTIATFYFQRTVNNEEIDVLSSCHYSNL